MINPKLREPFLLVDNQISVMSNHLLAALVGTASSLLSLFFRPSPVAMRRLTAFSGILLLISALGGFGVPLAFVAGFLTVWLVHRYIHPICPACTHDHQHAACPTRLHGFGLPMLLALALHSFADGLSSAQFGTAAAVVLHKIPEGFAMVILFRAALERKLHIIAAIVIIQWMTVAGGLSVNGAWAEPLKSLAAGSMLYLGLHSLHALGESWPVFVPIRPFLEFITHSQQSVLVKRAAHQGHTDR